MMSLRLLLGLCACLLLIAVEQTRASQLTGRTPRENVIPSRPTIIYSTIGTHVILNCHVEGIHAYNRSWYTIFVRNGQRIGELLNDDSYELSMTFSFNDGIYQCLTSAGGIESPMSNAFLLNVSSFAIQPGPVAILHNRNGTHRLLTCYDDSILPYIKPSIYWYKNDRLNVILSPRVNQTYILSMTSHDEGNYTCETRGVWGRETPQRSDTFEFVMSEFDVTPPRPTILNSTRGRHHIVLTCHVENHQELSQPWSYLWWKNDEHIASLFNLDSYAFLMRSQDEGNYRCEMDAGGARSSRSNTFVFDMAPPAPPPRPTILYSTIGTNVILTCHVEGILAYDFHWYYIFLRNDRRIAELLNDDSYELSMTSSSSDGVYRCLVTTGGLAQSPLSNAFLLNVSSFAILPGPVTILYNSNETHIVLTCYDENRTALWDPWTYWYKNERLNVILKDQVNHSYVLSMTSHDEGNYSCETRGLWERETPSQRSDTFEFVMSEFEATPPKPTILHSVSRARHNVLTCHVENLQEFSQPWSYLWWKNDEHIASLVSVESYEFSMTSQGEGNYSCEVDAGGARSPRSNTFVFDMSPPARPTILYSRNETHVILTCRFEERSTYSRHWYYNYIFEQNGQRIARLVNEDSIELYIFDSFSDGMYRCSVSAWGYISPLSNAFQLVVSSYAIVPGPVAIFYSTNGTHILLTCHDENIVAYERPMTVWYKDRRFLVMLSHNTNHSYALSMTSDNEGNYTCKIIDERSWRTMPSYLSNILPRSATFEFVMTEFEATPPRPTLSRRTRVPDHIFLTCHVENHQQFSQPWSYLWWKNDELIAAIFFVETMELPMTSQYKGNYSCVMDAGGTRSPRSNTLIIGAIPPRPTILYSTIGTRVILTCYVEDIHAYNRSWYYIFERNDQRIAELVNYDSYELSITTPRIDGFYRCFVTAGGLTRSPLSNAFMLVVSTFAIQPGPVAILHNRNGTHRLLTCYDENMRSYARPWTYWYKNEMLDVILKPRQVNYAYVLSMTSQDEGNYSCEIIDEGESPSQRSDTFEFVISEFEVTPPRPTILHSTTWTNHTVLTCYIENYQEFSQPWSYLWWKNDELIASFFNLDGYVFSMTSQNEGNYSCKMDAGGAGSPRSNTFEFVIQASDIGNG